MNHLNGEWHATAVTLGGADQPPQNLVLKIDRNHYEVLMNGKSIDKGTTNLLLGGKMEIASQGPQGPKLKAIYKREGDGMIICYDLSGKEFPESFSSEPGSQDYLVAYKRQKSEERMSRIVLIYGLIAGAIVAAMMFITMPMYKSGTLNLDNGEYVGYTTMVIALSMIFFGIKSYRDNYLNGLITFGKGVKVGLLISLIAAAMYGLAWEICYTSYGNEFTEKMEEHYAEKMKKSGASEEEMRKAKDQMANFSELYKNPVIRFSVTIMEILPVGLAITLLSAGLLRIRKFLPATS